MKKLLFLSILTVLLISAIGQSPKKIIQLPVETAINDSDLIFIGHPADGRLQQAEISKLFDAIGNVNFTGSLDIYKRDDSVFYLIDTVEHFAFIDSASDLETTAVLSIYKRNDSVFYSFNDVESFAFIDSVGNTTPGYILDQYAIQQTARAWFDSVKIAKATVLKSGLNSSPSTGFLITNETPATASQVQIAPRIEMRGKAIAANTSTSTPWSVYFNAHPTNNSGTTIPFGTFTIGTSWGTMLTLTDGIQPANTLVHGYNFKADGYMQTDNITSVGSYTYVTGSNRFGNNIQLSQNGYYESLDKYKLQVIGEQRVYGGLFIDSIARPPAFTITNGGTPGSTQYNYELVAEMITGQTSEASLPVSTATGHAVLDGTNKNILTIAYAPGVYRYKVYRTVNGANPSDTGFIGYSGHLLANGGQLFTDNGIVADGNSPPSINTTASLGIGTSTPQGALDVSSTTQGALPIPRMTKAQRDALSNPVEGWMVFVTDNGGYISWYHSGWFKVSSSAD